MTARNFRRSFRCTKTLSPSGVVQPGSDGIDIHRDSKLLLDPFSNATVNTGRTTRLFTSGAGRHFASFVVVVDIVIV